MGSKDCFWPMNDRRADRDRQRPENETDRSRVWDFLEGVLRGECGWNQEYPKVSWLNTPEMRWGDLQKDVTVHPWKTTVFTEKVHARVQKANVRQRRTMEAIHIDLKSHYEHQPKTCSGLQLPMVWKSIHPHPPCPPYTHASQIKTYLHVHTLNCACLFTLSWLLVTQFSHSQTQP